MAEKELYESGLRVGRLIQKARDLYVLVQLRLDEFWRGIEEGSK